MASPPGSRAIPAEHGREVQLVGKAGRIRRAMLSSWPSRAAVSATSRCYETPAE
jgi:hypothetical protein